MKDRIGKRTEREDALINVIVDGMDKFMRETGSLDRAEFMAAYSFLARVLFTIQTPIKDPDEQCKEIEAFCEFLKGVARKAIT